MSASKGYILKLGNKRLWRKKIEQDLEAASCEHVVEMPPVPPLRRAGDDEGDEGDEGDDEGHQGDADVFYKDKSERNLRVLDRMTNKDTIEANWKHRLRRDRATARRIIWGALSEDAQEETIEMSVIELWQWCRDFGRESEYLSAELKEEELVKVTLKSCGNDMAAYTTKFRAAYRALRDIEPDRMTHGAFLKRFMRNMGKDVRIDKDGKQGQFYQTKVDMERDMRQGITVSWSKAKSAFEARAEAIKAEESDPDSEESDGDANHKADVIKEESANLHREIAQMREAIVLMTNQQAPQHQRQRGGGRGGGGGRGRGTAGRGSCYVCGKPGHFARECYHRSDRDQDRDSKSRDRRRGDKRRHPPPGRGEQDSATDSDGEVFLCVDGASETHLTGSKLFRRMKNLTFPDNQEVKMNHFPSAVVARGDLSVTIDGNKIILYNVAYVPDSEHNIISVSRLLDDHGGYVTHSRKFVMFSPEHGRYKVWGKKPDGRGLYFMQENKSSDSVVLGPTSTTTTASEAAKAVEDPNMELPAFRRAKAWAIGYMAKQHQRMHVGLRTIKEVLKRDQKELGLTDGQLSWLRNVTKDELPTECCDAAKVRRHNPKSESREERLQRRSDRRKMRRQRQKEKRQLTLKANPTNLKASKVTVDTAGPNVKSLTGNKNMFVATFSDDKGCALGFGRRKDEAHDFIKDNYPVWCNELKRPPTVLKTDRGGEYRNGAMEKWCKRKGVTHTFTAPHSSAGSAEKKIGTIQDIERAQRNWAQCPETFWEESSKHAATITDFVPSRAKGMKGKSPWEKRTGTKPRMHALRTWGCLMHTWISEEQRKRLENRGRPSMFVGLPEKADDGIRAYDAKTKTFYHAKVAEFDETTPYFVWWKRNQEQEKQMRAAVKEQLPASNADTSIKGLLDIKTANLYNVLQPVDNEEKAVVEEEESKYDQDQPMHEEPIHKDRRSERPKTQRGIYDPHAWEEEFKMNIVNAVTSTVRQINKKNHKKRNTRPQHWKVRSLTPKTKTCTYNTQNPLPSGMVPKTTEEAITGEDSEHWKKSMEDEINSLKEKKVFRNIHIKKVPKGRQLIRSRWVFDIKKNAEGEIVRYKSRLVAKGYLQVSGRDYGETFAPTPAIASIRLIIPLALRLRFTVHHQDVKTAFLNAKLKKKYRQYINVATYRLRRDSRPCPRTPEVHLWVETECT